MKTTELNLELTMKIQGTQTLLEGNQDDKSWEIKEGLETEESWNERQNKLIEKLDSLLNEATKNDLIAIMTKRVSNGIYSEKSIYSY